MNVAAAAARRVTPTGRSGATTLVARRGCLTCSNRRTGAVVRTVAEPTSSSIPARPVLRRQQVRTKRTAFKSRSKSELGTRLRGGNSGGEGGGGAGGEMSYPFGLRPADHTVLPPICVTPPPPPPKPGMRRLAAPLTALTVIGVTAYFYVYNQNDAYEYWEAVQRGGMLPGIGDDDDDDDDFDDEEEEDEGED